MNKKIYIIIIILVYVCIGCELSLLVLLKKYNSLYLVYFYLR